MVSLEHKTEGSPLTPGPVSVSTLIVIPNFPADLGGILVSLLADGLPFLWSQAPTLKILWPCMAGLFSWAGMTGRVRLLISRSIGLRHSRSLVALSFLILTKNHLDNVVWPLGCAI